MGHCFKSNYHKKTAFIQVIGAAGPAAFVTFSFNSAPATRKLQDGNTPSRTSEDGDGRS